MIPKQRLGTHQNNLPMNGTRAMDMITRELYQDFQKRKDIIEVDGRDINVIVYSHAQGVFSEIHR